MKTFRQIAQYDCIYIVKNDKEKGLITITPELVYEICPAATHDIMLKLDNKRCLLNKPQFDKTKVVYNTDAWAFADDMAAINFATELRWKMIEKIRKQIDDLQKKVTMYENNTPVFG